MTNHCNSTRDINSDTGAAGVVARKWKNNAVVPIDVVCVGGFPIELKGAVTQVLPGTTFRVALPNGHEVLTPGKMRKHFIRISVGDYVRVEMCPYDINRARITFRQ